MRHEVAAARMLAALLALRALRMTDEEFQHALGLRAMSWSGIEGRGVEIPGAWSDRRLITEATHRLHHRIAGRALDGGTFWVYGFHLASTGGNPAMMSALVLWGLGDPPYEPAGWPW